MTLGELGYKMGTDKGDATDDMWHSYLPIYEQLFESFRDESFSLLELGVASGGSMRMWREWFPNASLFGVDNDPAHCIRPDTVAVATLYHGEQDDDKLFAEKFTDKQFQIIIDDAEHDPKKQMLSFMLLWRCVKPGGFYIVEDVRSEHWAEYWDSIPGATVHRLHKNQREDDLLVVIEKPL